MPLWDGCYCFVQKKKKRVIVGADCRPSENHSWSISEVINWKMSLLEAWQCNCATLESYPPSAVLDKWLTLSYSSYI
jgi:hypothetical protein